MNFYIVIVFDFQKKKNIELVLFVICKIVKTNLIPSNTLFLVLVSS